MSVLREKCLKNTEKPKMKTNRILEKIPLPAHERDVSNPKIDILAVIDYSDGSVCNSSMQNVF